MAFEAFKYFFSGETDISYLQEGKKNELKLGTSSPVVNCGIAVAVVFVAFTVVKSLKS